MLESEEKTFMKHLIIFNGYAGEGKAIEYKQNIDYSFNDLDYEVHVTKEPGEATTFLREYLSKNTDPVRVYSCGGDGTLYECVNGIVGFDNVELACYAIGTGNDFVKVYGGQEKFLDLIKLIKGKSTGIDLTKLECESFDRPLYSINVINFGFDAIVGAYGNKYKLKGKKDPYSKALLPAIMKGRFNKISVSVDGEIITKKKMLLCTLAQGKYVGGKFFCSPRSDNTDGLIDVCLLHAMSLFGFLGILGDYTAGKHMDMPKYSKKVVHKRGTSITIEAEKNIDICIDGEMVTGKKFEASIVPKAIKFIIPE